MDEYRCCYLSQTIIRRDRKGKVCEVPRRQTTIFVGGYHTTTLSLVLVDSVGYIALNQRNERIAATHTNVPIMENLNPSKMSTTNFNCSPFTIYTTTKPSISDMKETRCLSPKQTSTSVLILTCVPIRPLAAFSSQLSVSCCSNT